MHLIYVSFCGDGNERLEGAIHYSSCIHFTRFFPKGDMENTQRRKTLHIWIHETRSRYYLIRSKSYNKGSGLLFCLTLLWPLLLPWAVEIKSLLAWSGKNYIQRRRRNIVCSNFWASEPRIDPVAISSLCVPRSIFREPIVGLLS